MPSLPQQDMGLIMFFRWAQSTINGRMEYPSGLTPNTQRAGTCDPVLDSLGVLNCVIDLVVVKREAFLPLWLAILLDDTKSLSVKRRLLFYSVYSIA